jgi:hypothetical protein
MVQVIVKVARLGPVPACLSALCVALCVAGCAGGSSAPPPPPPPVLSVSLSSTSASVQAGIGTQGFTATVQNDSQSKGVNWTLTQSGANCSPACGTLSATSSASGTPITYTAPSNQPNPSDVMLTAISVADSTKSQVAKITVTPSVAVSVSPAPINVQFNAIEDFTATVQNDSQSKGVKWTLTQSGTNCSPGCGTLSVTSSASGTPIRYTGPSSVPSNPSVTLTATSVTDTARSFPAAITVTGNPGNTAVAVSPKRAAITKWQTQSFVATVTGANDMTVTWQVDTIPNGNSTVGTIDSNGKYTPPSTAGAHTITVVSNADVTKSVMAPIGVTDLPGVYTYHNDISRTGANTQEFALTNATVTAATFGRLFSCSVDAAIYAQPLWVANLTIGGAPHNVVFVATQRDTLYAFDADANPCVTYWKTGTNGVNSLIPPGETWVTSSDVGCADLVPDIGITGTPVIDPVTNTLYVVTKTKTIPGAPATYHQRLHALSILNGSEKFGGPTDIHATVPGNGNGSSGNPPTVSFDPSLNGQRPALLLENGHVIISWASHCDFGPYLGWVMSYSANALAQEAVFNASPNGALSGVWMSGNGPAADAGGNIYFATGNGSWDGITNFGDSIVKLGPPSAGSFPAASFDYFTPINQDSLGGSGNDTDVGSGGLLLLPDIAGAHPHVLVQAGKEGKIYLIDRDNMGHIFCSPISSCADPTRDPQIAQELPNAVGGMWGSPAYWNGNLYFGGSGDNLKAFSVSANAASPISNNPTSQSGTGAFGFPGATPSVSASTTTNGVVWALDVSQYCTQQSPGCGNAVLHSYNATNLGTELWNSSQVTSDKAGFAVKFNVPTVANGKVYIGTRGNDTGAGTSSILGELDVYGLKPN